MICSIIHQLILSFDCARFDCQFVCLHVVESKFQNNLRLFPIKYIVTASSSCKKSQNGIRRSIAEKAEETGSQGTSMWSRSGTPGCARCYRPQTVHRCRRPHGPSPSLPHQARSLSYSSPGCCPPGLFH